MPRSGAMDVQAFAAANAREIDGFKTGPWELKGARILNVYYEISNDLIVKLLPVTFHPVVPAYAIFNLAHYPDSPAGPFSIAEVRIGCRAGVRSRGFVLRSYADSEKAADELARRWGYPAVVGMVALKAYHDRVVGRVATGDRTVLEVEMIDREPISGADIQYTSSMHLARNKEDGKLALVQVDPEWVFHQAERGRPNIVAFDPKAWGVDDQLAANYPISASYTTCDVTLTKIRYVCDPDKDAFRGTTQIAP